MIVVRRDARAAQFGFAGDHKAVRAFLDLRAQLSQFRRQRSDAIRFLHAQFLRVAHQRFAARLRGGNRQDRKFVNHARHLRAENFRRAQIAGAHDHVAHRLARFGACIFDGDLRAHACQRVEQPGARRVDAHAFDANFGARDD